MYYIAQTVFETYGNMQHHLQLLCYVHLSGISENQARDSAKKISEKSSRVQPFQ